MNWNNLTNLPARKFRCGYCDSKVASKEGYATNDSPNGQQAQIYVCPGCGQPSFFHYSLKVPSTTPGNDVAHLPKDVESLFVEARRSAGAGANTAAVLACRKLLMNVAVSQGAKAGESFLSYVEFLASAGYVPPNGRAWIDHIRSKGNEATHEIHVMKAEDATELISFAEMLLKFVFEFPAKVPKKP